MTRLRPLPVLVGALVLVIALASVALAASRNFAAPLSGDQEVPPVETKATGVAKLKLSKDGETLRFRLNVANIRNVTQAHIHLGERGVNGDVVAWLYPSGPPPLLIPGRTQGTLAKGTITGDDLVGPLAGQPLSALLDAIRAGEAYVNVHTDQHPGGEIRGQIDRPRGRVGG